MNNRIIVMNADGRTQSLVAILRMIREINPIAILLQDPPRDIEEFIDIFNSAGLTHIKPTQSTLRTDNLIMVRRDAVCKPLLISHTTISASAEVKLSNESKFLLTSIYIRPRTSYAALKSATDKLEECAKAYGQSRSLMAGDINATDPQWAPAHEVAPEADSNSHSTAQLGIKHYQQIKLTRGKQMARFFDKLKLTYINDPNKDPPTFVNRQAHKSASHISVVAVGNKAIRRWCRLEIRDIGLQHRMLIVDTKADSSDPAAKTTHKTFKTDNINDQHFQALRIEFSELTHNLEQINRAKMISRAERMTSSLIRNLLAAQEAVSVTRPDRGQRMTKPIACLRAKTQKLTARLARIEDKIRTGKRSRDMARGHLRTLKANRNKLKSNIIARIRRETIPSDTLADLELWKRVEAMRDPADITLPQPDQEMTREQLNKIANEKFEGPEQVADATAATTSRDEKPQGPIIQLPETLVALRAVRNRKFTGPEGLRYATLLHAAKFITPILHTWVATCMRAAYSPIACKTTKGIIIPKKTPGKFRIVHVGSPLASLLERVALARLNYRLEQQDMLCRFQFGFTTKVGRHDLVTRVIELTIRNAMRESAESRRHYTTIVSLDIQGAFDNVNQGILVNKVMEELFPDPVRHWIANFIVGRSTSLRYKDLQSCQRPVIKGVPQGSILGPILWNYAINKISERISLPNGELEPLTYADDIIMVYLGNDHTMLQHKVEELVEELQKLKLAIEPDKCSIMSIRLGQRGTTKSDNLRATPTISIYGQAISKVDSISILGVPITNLLRLNLDDCKSKISSKDNIQLLNQLQRYRIIRQAKEWNIILDSYLTSVLIMNNLPMLAVDPGARKWCDKTMARSIKKIFDWPVNVSNKAARRVANMDATCEAYVTQTLTTKSTHPNGNGYKLLQAYMQCKGSINALRNRADKSQASDETTRHLDYQNIWALNTSEHIRRQHNPAMNQVTTAEMFDNIKQLSEKRGPLWLAFEGGKVATAVELLHADILQYRIGRQNEFAVGYFNLMGLLWKLADSQNTYTRTLVLSEANSALAALANMTNSDWRVILLREKLHQNGWHICTLSKDTFREVKDTVMLRLSQLHDMEDDTPHFHQPDLRLRAQVEWLTWPPTLDREESNNAKRAFKAMTDHLKAENNTSFMRLLTNGNTEDEWADLNPGWINGRVMLMLTGMVSAKGALVRGELLPGETPKGCDPAGCARPTTNEEAQSPVNAHTTLHRAFNCHKYRGVRSEIRQTINKALAEEYLRRTGQRIDMPFSLMSPWLYGRSITITLQNKRFAQTLLRLLTQVAMSNE